MKKLFALVSILRLLSGCLPPAKPTYALKDAAVYVEMVGSGTCSGTIIGPHAILSAAHCFDPLTPILVNGVPVRVLSAMVDHADHEILIVNQTYLYWARRGAAPAQSDPVQLYGNPGGKVDWYRRGYMAGMDTDAAGRPLRVYDLNGYFGDSGSGIFNAAGELVAVTSVCDFENDQGVQFKMMASYDLRFTDQQWAVAAV